MFCYRIVTFVFTVIVIFCVSSSESQPGPRRLKCMEPTTKADFKSIMGAYTVAYLINSPVKYSCFRVFAFNNGKTGSLQFLSKINGVHLSSVFSTIKLLKDDSAYLAYDSNPNQLLHMHHEVYSNGVCVCYMCNKDGTSQTIFVAYHSNGPNLTTEAEKMAKTISPKANLYKISQPACCY